jgi:hypothetical protein
MEMIPFGQRDKRNYRQMLKKAPVIMAEDERILY